MRWWCSAVEAPWDWTPRPYLGVWVLCLGLSAWYVVSWRRHGSTGPADDGDRRLKGFFAAGIVALWIASDWPVGTLGGGYMASLHMLQYMLYTLAAAPLLMLGTPEWLAESVLDKLHLQRVWRTLSRPLLAAIITNVILVSTHSPFAVDRLRSTQMGSFAMDMIWLFSGLVLWAPLINPVRDARMKSAPLKIVYLFLAAAVLPMIPGGFIAFSPQPLYETYELAPRVWLSPIEDQQFAGVLMKIGNLPIIWAVMGVIWFRWYQLENKRPAHRAAPQPRAAVPVGAGLEPPAPAAAVSPSGPGGPGEPKVS